mgnify:CR=1 FL=1
MTHAIPILLVLTLGFFQRAAKRTPSHPHPRNPFASAIPHRVLFHRSANRAVSYAVRRQDTRILCGVA